MEKPSLLARVLCFFVIFCGITLGLPLAAQVSYNYTAPPPPGYPAPGAPARKTTVAPPAPRTTRATRQSAAAVQAPVTQYPASYPPPAGYTYPPPLGYGPPPRPGSSKTAAKPGTTKSSVSKSGSKTTVTKKAPAGPPPPPSTKPKVYGPTGDLTTQVSRIKDSDRVQNMRIGELERDVSSIKRGGKGSSAPRYDGGTDIAAHTTYVARPGDTLFRIASTHRVSVGEIQQLNRMTEEEVHVGQTLLIPSPHRMSSPLTQVSYRPATPGDDSAPVTTTTKVVSNSTTYTVKKGDSLKAIALKHKMTISALAAANRIKDANKIIVGQRLTIPGKTVVVATKPATRSSSLHADHDTVPLPDYNTASAPPPPASGLGMAPAPLAPQEPASPPAPPRPAANVADSHRGILAYRVDRSDTMESIAQQFSTTPEKIREMNRLQAGTALKSGDEIMVPAMGAVSVGR